MSTSIELAGVLGEVAGLGDDHGDRLADEAHVAVGEQPERAAAGAALEVDPAPRARRALRSAPVNTATTPGSSRAAVDVERA